MSKHGQYIHILLDNSTYIAAKSKGVILSDVGRKLFKAWVEYENIETPEESFILSEMEEIKSQQKANEQRYSILAAQLAKARLDKSNETKAREKELDSKLDAVRMNNPMRNVMRGAEQ